MNARPSASAAALPFAVLPQPRIPMRTRTLRSSLEGAIARPPVRCELPLGSRCGQREEPLDVWSRDGVRVGAGPRRGGVMMHTALCPMALRLPAQAHGLSWHPAHCLTVGRSAPEAPDARLLAARRAPTTELSSAAPDGRPGRSRHKRSTPAQAALSTLSAGA